MYLENPIRPLNRPQCQAYRMNWWILIVVALVVATGCTGSQNAKPKAVRFGTLVGTVLPPQSPEVCRRLAQSPDLQALDTYLISLANHDSTAPGRLRTVAQFLRSLQEEKLIPASSIQGAADALDRLGASGIEDASAAQDVSVRFQKLGQDVERICKFDVG
jgi:hypothetical protein